MDQNRMEAKTQFAEIANEPGFSAGRNAVASLTAVLQILPSQHVTESSQKTLIRKMASPLFSFYVQVLIISVLDLFQAGSRQRGEPTQPRLQRAAEKWFQSESVEYVLDAENIFLFLEWDRMKTYRALRAIRAGWTADGFSPEEIRELAKKRFDFRETPRGLRHKIEAIRWLGEEDDGDD